MIKPEIKKILLAFLGWRALLFVFLFGGALFFPLQKNFLGGGLGQYLPAPWFWAWSNFDGEHYLAIARHGYGQGEQAFFPFFPFLIKLFAVLFGKSLFSLNISGLLIANVSFILALIGLYKLLRIDFSEKISLLTLFLLAIFPTSFYFGSLYTESLFLALAVWSIYFARKGRWFWAGILGAFSSATRVIGILLFPVLVTEFFISRRSSKTKSYELLWTLLVPLGLVIYLVYLKQTTGDALAFLHTLPGFGEQRSATPIILPQVFFRYIFRILPNLNYAYFPVVFTTLMEFLTASIFLVFAVVSFFKLRLSYALFLAAGYLIPTLSGSFSSLPRYVLVLFPGFLLLALWFAKTPKLIRIVIVFVLIAMLGIATALFVRGYWVS